MLLAYYDNGGPEIAYHSYDDVNHGSCELNPCDGQYKNVFRKVMSVGMYVGMYDDADRAMQPYIRKQNDGASTSYTKPPNGDWPGDRFFGNKSQVGGYVCMYDNDDDDDDDASGDLASVIHTARRI